MRAFWPLLRTWLWRLVSVPLALILLFEEWGWRPLAAALAALAHVRPLAALEDAIGRLPPYPALVVFVIPGALLFPVKLAGLWLLAQGKVLTAGLVIAAAKVVSTALVARIFQLTRPALMRLSWFARLYNWLMPWKEAIFARIRASWAWRYGRMVKGRVRQGLRRLSRRWAPHVERRVVRWRAAARRRVLRLKVMLRRWKAGATTS